MMYLFEVLVCTRNGYLRLKLQVVNFLPALDNVFNLKEVNHIRSVRANIPWQRSEQLAMCNM